MKEIVVYYYYYTELEIKSWNERMDFRIEPYLVRSRKRKNSTGRSDSLITHLGAIR